MKTRLLALLIVFFSSVGLLSAQSSSPCPPNCEWVSVGTQPPGCVCDELFIDGSGLYIVLFARSEERRVGKECRSRWAASHQEGKKDGGCVRTETANRREVTGQHAMQ